MQTGCRPGLAFLQGDVGATAGQRGTQHRLAEVIRKRTPPSVERSADVHAVRNVGQGLEGRCYRRNNGSPVTAVVEQGLDALIGGQGTPSAPWSVARGFAGQRPRHGPLAALGHRQGDGFQSRSGLVVVRKGLHWSTEPTIEVPALQPVRG